MYFLLLTTKKLVGKCSAGHGAIPVRIGSVSGIAGRGDSSLICPVPDAKTLPTEKPQRQLISSIGYFRYLSITVSFLGYTQYLNIDSPVYFDTLCHKMYYTMNVFLFPLIVDGEEAKAKESDDGLR